MHMSVGEETPLKEGDSSEWRAGVWEGRLDAFSGTNHIIKSSVREELLLFVYFNIIFHGDCC